jgi:CheY-like chemotaxis protein
MASANFGPLVLIVDDDDDTRRSIREILVEEGYLVEGAVNGRDALARLNRPPLPALVLLDLMMPVMDGQTFLGEIEARPDLAALPIVILTASDVNEASSTLKAPMLRKPVGVEALLTMVEQYAPRFWDEEALTDEVSLSGDGEIVDDDKAK